MKISSIQETCMIMYCLNVLDILHIILYIKNDIEISIKSHWIEKNLNSKYKVILSFIYNINKYCLLSYQLWLSILSTQTCTVLIRDSLLHCKTEKLIAHWHIHVLIIKVNFCSYHWVSKCMSQKTSLYCIIFALTVRYIFHFQISFRKDQNFL